MGIDHNILVSDLSKEEELTDDEIAIRTLFVHEFLKDYDPVAAARRCGFIELVAKEYALAFVQEPFVQRLISELQLKIPDENEQNPPTDINDPAVGKQKVKMHLHQIASGNVAASTQSVQALTLLYKYYHMDEDHKPKGPENNGLPAGGVMQVPGMLSVEHWESASINSQTKLKEDVRD